MAQENDVRCLEVMLFKHVSHHFLRCLVPRQIQVFDAPAVLLPVKRRVSLHGHQNASLGRLLSTSRSAVTTLIARAAL